MADERGELVLVEHAARAPVIGAAARFFFNTWERDSTSRDFNDLLAAEHRELLEAWRELFDKHGITSADTSIELDDHFRSYGVGLWEEVEDE
jgi:hypothetical protein